MKETTVRGWTGSSEQRWEGTVYNAQNGKTYNANIKLQSPNVLKIEGCVLGGIFCGGEEWTRATSTSASPVAATKGSAPKSTGSSKAGAAAGAAAPASDVCSRIANLAGRPH
jgi:hypothetical protein